MNQTFLRKTINLTATIGESLAGILTVAASLTVMLCIPLAFFRRPADAQTFNCLDYAPKAF